MDGNQVRKLRLALNLNQKELAKQLSMSARTVSRWETSGMELEPIVETAIKLYIRVLDLEHRLKERK